jgi:hypothetical protein
LAPAVIGSDVTGAITVGDNTGRPRYIGIIPFQIFLLAALDRNVKIFVAVARNATELRLNELS